MGRHKEALPFIEESISINTELEDQIGLARIQRKELTIEGNGRSG